VSEIHLARGKVLDDGAYSKGNKGIQFLQDVFVTVENARIQWILGGDRGNHQWVSVIVLNS
jgi:hypothetical protein